MEHGLLVLVALQQPLGVGAAEQEQRRLVLVGGDGPHERRAARLSGRGRGNTRGSRGRF